MGRLLDEDTIIKVLEHWKEAFKENSHHVSASDLSLVIKDVRELPSVQPETHKERTETHACDLISRQAAIDALKQPEPPWIPVSERLPKIGEYVLCYLKSRRYFGHYRVCIYRAADKYINHPYFDFNENGFPDVIAWMPLPEHYKPNNK